MSSATQAPDRTSPKWLAREYAARLEDLKADFIGRDEAIEVIALATLCREHVLLVGPPGTAKTALLTRFARLLDTEPFTYLLTRFTEPTELFGPVDVKQFQDNSVFRVNTDGMLPKARLAFLDEVFEGSSAILNSLLTLINERTFYNGSKPEPSDLITLLGASNDVPEDPVLAAFSDRFLLRCELTYVDGEDIGRVLDVGWRGEEDLIRAVNHRNGRGAFDADRDDAQFALSALAILQSAVATVDLTPVRAVYTEILRDLRAQRVAFSDRRAVKAQKVFAASALLAGRREAEVSDLSTLTYLWTDRRDEDAIRRALEAHDIHPAGRSKRLREVGEIKLALDELVNRRAAARTEQDLWAVSEQIQALMIELRTEHPKATQLLHEVQQVRAATVDMIQERFREAEGNV
jgi:MoxR-like ATPase